MKGIGLKRPPTKATEKEYFKKLKQNLIYFLGFAIIGGLAPYAIEKANEMRGYVGEISCCFFRINQSPQNSRNFRKFQISHLFLFCFVLFVFGCCLFVDMYKLKQIKS